MDYSAYKLSDVFKVMGCCWVLEEEFNYLIDPTLRNSPPVHSIMRQE